LGLRADTQGKAGGGRVLAAGWRAKTTCPARNRIKVTAAPSGVVISCSSMATPVAKVLTGVHPGWVGTVVVVVGSCTAICDDDDPVVALSLAWLAVGDWAHPASAIAMNTATVTLSAPLLSMPPDGFCGDPVGDGHSRPTTTKKAAPLPL
jgi:hypothetical protein